MVSLPTAHVGRLDALTVAEARPRRRRGRTAAAWRRLRGHARLSVALLGALAILGTQQFLSVHALHHLGQTDHTHCEYAPLAATAGGGVLVTAPALAAPCLAGRVEMPPPQAPDARITLTKGRARAPPLA